MQKEITNSELFQVLQSMQQGLERNEQSHQEILETISIFAESVDSRFDGIDTRFEGIDNRIDGIDRRLNRVEALMVTKDYLNEKLWSLRGDLVSMIRREVGKHITQFHAA
ncbi:MAG: hypothetical protein ABIA47_00935 [bacterium]